MANDKKTIGLTSRTRRVMDQVMEQAVFKDQIDVAKFALALAINYNAKLDRSEGAETVWNVGSFDPDGEIKNLIMALFPDVETPYRQLEYLVNTGLEIIGDYMNENKVFDIVSLIKMRSNKAEDLY